MDKIRNGMEAQGVEELIIAATGAREALSELAWAADDMNEVEVAELARGTRKELKAASVGFHSRLEEYEGRS